MRIAAWSVAVALVSPTFDLGIGALAQDATVPTFCPDVGDLFLESSFNFCDALLTTPATGQFWEILPPTPRQYVNCRYGQRRSEPIAAHTFLRSSYLSPIITSTGTDSWDVEYHYSASADIEIFRPEWPGMTADQIALIDQEQEVLLQHELGHANLLGRMIAAQSVVESYTGVPAGEIEQKAHERALQLSGALKSMSELWQSVYDSVTNYGLNQSAVGGTNVHTFDYDCDWEAEATLLRQEYLTRGTIQPGPANSHFVERWVSDEQLGTSFHEVDRKYKGTELQNEISLDLPALGFTSVQFDQIAQWDTPSSHHLATGTLSATAYEIPGGLVLTGGLVAFYDQLDGPPFDRLGSAGAGVDLLFAIEGGSMDATIYWQCTLSGIYLVRTKPTPAVPFIRWPEDTSEECSEKSFLLPPGTYHFRANAAVPLLVDPPPTERMGSFQLTLEAPLIQ